MRDASEYLSNVVRRIEAEDPALTELSFPEWNEDPTVEELFVRFLNSLEEHGSNSNIRAVRVSQALLVFATEQDERDERVMRDAFPYFLSRVTRYLPYLEELVVVEPPADNDITGFRKEIGNSVSNNICLSWILSYVDHGS